jgi:phage baseplate assembly protein W
MGKPVYRAIRFVHPDLDAEQDFSGLGFSRQGGMAMVQDEPAVRQAILLLLSTRPGERVMRPEYGCEISRLLFSPNDDTTAGLAIHYVRRALERWEPRVEIIALDAARNPVRPELLDVSLTYRVRATLWTDAIAFSLSLNGEDR